MHTARAQAEDEDRRMRFLAIALMCATMICFTGQDTCAKWLSASLPIAQIVWARYVGAAVIALAASRSLSRPAMLRSRRPRLQLLRSVLLFCSTTANIFAVRELQLSETATISFLTPVFVALLAGPVLGEKVSAERMIAIALGFLGVVIATRPGTAAFQPIVLVAVAGVVCNSGYVLATRKLAGADSAQTNARLDANRRHRVLNSNIAVDLAAAPVGSRLADHGGYGRLCGHEPRNADRRASVCAGADLDPFHLHPAHLDGRIWRAGLWRLACGFNSHRRGFGRRVWGLSRASRAQRQAGYPSHGD